MSLIIINKKNNFSSHDIVNDVRHIFGTKQVGHLGTLDPLASGVLVVCVGEATKLVQFLESVSKEYVCEACIGIGSDTYDSTGEILERRCVDSSLTTEMIDSCLKSFMGVVEQQPPIYSAIKVKGKKLYEYARKNMEVEIPTRKVEIYEIERVSDVMYVDGIAKFSFRCVVSKGTYIRSICHDLGVKLGYPCLMSGLCRTRNGEFTLDMSSTIDDVRVGNYRVVTMIEATNHIPTITGDDFVRKATNGMKISPVEVKKILGDTPNMIRIIDGDRLVGIYLFDQEIYGYKAGRVWN